jgi:two-component system osmolarity sensor histidine kinase EnvZ
LAGWVAAYRSRGEPVTFQQSALPRLPLRPVAIQRLVGNLIDNALKYGAPPLEVAAKLEARHVLICVSGHGPGIPEAELEHALQPFNRLDAARATQGSGLGLAIADRIARLHGGRIQLRNRPGGGLEAGAWLSTCSRSG